MSGDMRNRIKEHRKAKGLTLTGLADLLQVSNQQISHLENGRRGLTIEWVERLAHALDCHPFELVFDGHYARSDHEEKLLQVFRKLSLEQQAAVLNAAVIVLR